MGGYMIGHLRLQSQVLKYMWFAKIAGGTHQEKLESFYKAQADLYDSYRFRMLHGRLPMIRKMPTPAKGVWLDMGGGTGSNLEYFGPNLKHFGKVIVLDLCPSLAKQVRRDTARPTCYGSGLSHTTHRPCMQLPLTSRRVALWPCLTPVGRTAREEERVGGPGERGGGGRL